MSDPATLQETLHMTIKHMPVKTRNAASAAAKNAKQTMGEWAADAFNEKITRDSGGTVVPARAFAPPAPLAALPALDLAGLAHVLDAVSSASKNPDAPKALVRDTVTTVRAQLRQARGLPPSKPRASREPDSGRSPWPLQMIEADGP